MGRKKKYAERITLPLLAGKSREIDAMLQPGETRVDFIRDAIEALLKRRSER
jgi:metal-responsive CopG/Arc/MetJ family transcriptional regulator